MKTVTLSLIKAITQEEAQDFFCEAEAVCIKNGEITFTADEDLMEFILDMAFCEGIAE
jgi:hypothetical protein